MTARFSQAKTLKRCEWCGKPDHSVGKIEEEPDCCFTCQYIRREAHGLAQTSRGRKFLRKILRDAPKSAGQR